MNFEKVNNLINELNESNSNNDKKEVLKKYNDPEIKKLLSYVYSSYTQFNVTSKNLKKRNDLCEDNQLELFELLDKLNNREITGHKALAITNGYIKNNEKWKELIYKIIDKNLETRTSAKTINKIFPGCVKEFSVSLAKKYEEKKVDFDKEDLYTNRKLDGIRCICRIENNSVKFFSRKGKELYTLNTLVPEVKKYSGYVLDGEICIMKDKNEDFQSVIKEIRRKNHTIKNPKYIIFDILTLDEFDNQKSKVKLIERCNRLEFDSPYLEKTENIKISSKEELEKRMTEAINNKWEGLMLKRNVGYKGKRSDAMLKVKKFSDAEYTIKEVHFGPIRYIKDGKDVAEEMLSNVSIEHKNNIVDVGSGFSIKERQYYYKHPDELIGKVATVKYFEETQDKHGNYSLRFPTVKVLHGVNREV